MWRWYEVGPYCQNAFGCLPVADIVKRRTCKFLQKFDVAANIICQACTRRWYFIYFCQCLFKCFFSFSYCLPVCGEIKLYIYKTGGINRTLFTSKTATEILYLRRPGQVDISNSDDVITRGISAKACRLTFLWIKSDIPLHPIFITDVDQVLKTTAATGQQPNVISV